MRPATDPNGWIRLDLVERVRPSNAALAESAIISCMRSAADAAGAWTESARASSDPGSRPWRSSSWPSSARRRSSAFSAAEGLLAWDVRFAYLPAAEAILDGDSPYPALDDPILEEQKGYVYPPQLLFVLVPLTPLPVDVASCSSQSGCSLCSLDAPRPRGARRSLLRRGAALGAVDQRRPARRTSRSRLRSHSPSLWRYRDACGRPRCARPLGVRKAAALADVRLDASRRDAFGRALAAVAVVWS